MVDETNSGSQVDLRKSRAIEALLASASVKDASALCGIPIRTLWRMLRDPSFKADLREAQREIWGEIARQLLGTGSAAVKALLEITTDPNAKDAARVSAASKILDTIFRVIVDTDMVERLERLEAAVDLEEGQ